MEKNIHLYPIPAVGVIIYNQKQEILLIKNYKWKDVWTIPGGKIDLNETMLSAIKREIKEETNLEINQIDFLSVLDGINPPEFHKNKHFIFLNFSAQLISGEPQLSQEMIEYVWRQPEEALKEEKIAQSAIPVIKAFIVKQLTATPVDWQEKYKRSLADLQNFIKQNNKEKAEFTKFVLGDFLQELLPVYDHLKLSISSLSPAEKDNAWVTGVSHVLRQFKEVLNNHGVREIVTVGAKFDHHTMEAVEGQGELVVKEISPGYQLNGRLLKPAKVIVASEPENNNKK